MEEASTKTKEKCDGKRRSSGMATHETKIQGEHGCDLQQKKNKERRAQGRKGEACRDRRAPPKRQGLKKKRRRGGEGQHAI